jgi:hypothetical protein
MGKHLVHAYRRAANLRKVRTRTATEAIVNGVIGSWPRREWDRGEVLLPDPYAVVRKINSVDLALPISRHSFRRPGHCLI